MTSHQKPCPDTYLVCLEFSQARLGPFGPSSQASRAPRAWSIGGDALRASPGHSIILRTKEDHLIVYDEYLIQDSINACLGSNVLDLLGMISMGVAVLSAVPAPGMLPLSVLMYTGVERIFELRIMNPSLAQACEVFHYVLVTSWLACIGIIFSFCHLTTARTIWARRTAQGVSLFISAVGYQIVATWLLPNPHHAAYLALRTTLLISVFHEDAWYFAMRLRCKPEDLDLANPNTGKSKSILTLAVVVSMFFGTLLLTDLLRHIAMVVLAEPVMVDYFIAHRKLPNHFLQWEWYNGFLHEIPFSLVVLSSNMDGI